MHRPQHNAHLTLYIGEITQSCPKSRNKLAEANKAKIYEDIEVSDAVGGYLPLSNPHFEILAIIKY